jgi:hypothetical protein
MISAMLLNSLKPRRLAVAGCVTTGFLDAALFGITYFASLWTL